MMTSMKVMKLLYIMTRMFVMMVMVTVVGTMMVMQIGDDNRKIVQPPVSSAAMMRMSCTATA